MSRLVSTLSLDGDRISAELVVHFHRALSNATAESVADEIARATDEVLGEQISQGEVPLTKDELVEKVHARLSGGATRVSEMEVRSLQLVGGEAHAGRSTYRTRPLSPSPSAPPPRERYGSGAMPAVGSGSTLPSPAVTPPPPPVRTLWPGSLSRCPPGAGIEEIGQLLGPPLRDSIAAAILHAFVAIDPITTDRLGIFGGGSGIVSELLREVGACFATAAYRIFASFEIEQKVSSELVRVACRHALAPDDFPAAHVSRYMASEAPVRDLANRMAAVIGAPEAAAVIQTAVSPYCSVVRAELVSIAAQVRKLRTAG